MQVGKIFLNVVLFHMIYVLLKLNHELNSSVPLLLILIVNIDLHSVGYMLSELHPEIESSNNFNHIIVLHSFVLNGCILSDLFQIYYLFYFLLQSLHQFRT